MLEPITPVPIQPRRCVAGETKGNVGRGVSHGEGAAERNENWNRNRDSLRFYLHCLSIRPGARSPVAVYAIFLFFAKIF